MVDDFKKLACSHKLCEPVLTFNVTLLVHHRFITSTHPDTPVFFINLRHSLGLLIVLPISFNWWLAPTVHYSYTEVVRMGDPYPFWTR